MGGSARRTRAARALGPAALASVLAAAVGAPPALAGAPPAPSECVARLRAIFVRGDLSTGGGLPAGCRRAQLEEVFGRASSEARGRLGGGLARVAEYKRPSRGAPIRVWYQSEDALLLIEDRDPHLSAPAARLLATLGTPDQVVAGRYHVTGRHVSENIYVKRGLTLAVAEPLAGRRALRISALFVYAPTNLDYYFAVLGGGDTPEAVTPLPR
jgi:hypothetical protein